MTNCWEYKSCGCQPGGENICESGVCPAATTLNAHGINNGINAGRSCWAIKGTLCGGKAQRTFTEKLARCMNCDFYSKVRREEGVSYSGTKIIMSMLKALGDISKDIPERPDSSVQVSI